MDIKVNLKLKSFRITHDGRQYVLSEIKEKTEGKNIGQSYETDIGYYAKLDALLERIIMVEVEAQDITTLKHLLTEIRNTRKYLQDLVGGYSE
jgi:hypothetical protein